MKVCLILPKYSVSVHDPCCFPLGFMYISSVLKSLGHDVKVLNLNIAEYNVFEEISDMDAVLFTGFEEFSEYNRRIAGVCRHRGIHTVLGGAEATFNPNEAIKYFDSVIIGEGEDVIGTAIEKDGIFYAAKLEINENVLPDYEGFGIEVYNEIHHQKYIGVLTSRGCPYSCKFCVQTCRFQQRNLDKVFEEIKDYVFNYDITHIVFNDNTFNLNKTRFLAICQMMCTLNLTWSAAIRVDNFDENMAKAAKESGCNGFVVGVESFDNAKLERMGKGIRASQIENCLDLLHEYQIDYRANVLLGLPDETFEDIIAELQTIPTKYTIFPCLVQPFIGTAYQTRLITDDQATILQGAFKEYCELKGSIMWEGAK